MNTSKLVCSLSAIACVLGLTVHGTMDDSNKNIGPGRRVGGGFSGSSGGPMSSNSTSRQVFTGSDQGSDSAQQPPPDPSKEIQGLDGKSDVPASPKQN